MLRKCRCNVEYLEKSGLEIEIEKEIIEKKNCKMCGKSSLVFTDKDWVKFIKNGVCEKCFFNKVQ